MVASVAINSDGDLLEVSSSFNEWEKPSLVSALLGPYGNIKNTFDSLEGMILPQIHSQGEYYAFLHLPKPNIAVIVFGKGKEKAKEQYIHSKEIDETVNQLQW